MTWLYVPSISSASAPASADWNAASELPNPERAESLMWRGKPQQPQAWSRRWKLGGFIRLLSGLTLPLSTLDRGVAAFIASLPEIPASRTALPASEAEPATTASSSIRSSGLWTSAGLIVSFAKTSRGTLTGSSQPSSLHWSDWAIALRQEYSQRPALAPATGGSDCSSWQTEIWRTPQAGDSTRGEKTQRGSGTGYVDKAGKHSLVTEVATWATPCTRDHFPPHTTEYIAEKKAQGHGMRNLNDEAANWPTPCTRDHKGSGPVTIRADGKSRMDMLDYAAERGFAPFASVDLLLPDRPTPSGMKSAETRRTLNPLFVEWLMGWPEGLSGFERQETEFARWLQQMRGCLSALRSSRTVSQGTLF
nr:hypothetical protein [Sphingomonas paeninsulae]